MELSLETELCRFVVDRKMFHRQPPAPKLTLFMPRVGPGEEEPTLSTFNVDELSIDDIWVLGQVEVGDKRSRTIKARAHLRVKDIEAVGLSLNPNNVPPRHVNVESWPLQKARQLSIAQQLNAVVVESGTFSIRPKE